jgi:hypothetical protein
MPAITRSALAQKRGKSAGNDDTVQIMAARSSRLSIGGSSRSPFRLRTFTLGVRVRDQRALRAHALIGSRASG